MPFGPLVSTELTDDDKLDQCRPCVEGQPDFPWGVRISFDETLLERLGLDMDCDVGDTLELKAIARVTSKSENQTNEKTTCRVELTLEQIAVREDDDDE